MQTKDNLFEYARKYIPGGVNSPVRSFQSIGIDPVFMHHGKGASITDERGRSYIDYCMSWGALIAGHADPAVTDNIIDAAQKGTSFGTATRKEVELARMIAEAVPSIDRVRLVNSGTEAVMSAVRLARGYTGRDKVVKFEGAYHGHADHLLGRAGSGAATFGVPDCAGVPEDFVKHTLVLPFNDPEKLEDAIKEHGDSLAAIVTEPVMANCGVIPPRDGFLQQMREAADRCGAVLIFDEVITGFRLSYGGAQQCYGVTPDITCLGKIIGGGMPVGAFGGRKEIMNHLAPDGDVYQAGTLSGNPVSVSAGIAILDKLEALRPYKQLRERTERLCRGLEKGAEQADLDVEVSRTGSMFSLFFTALPPVDYNGAQQQDTETFAHFFRAMLKQGIYMSPSAFETNFLSIAHEEKDVEKTVEGAMRAFELCSNTG